MRVVSCKGMTPRDVPSHGVDSTVAVVVALQTHSSFQRWQVATLLTSPVMCPLIPIHSHRPMFFSYTDKLSPMLFISQLIQRYVEQMYFNNHSKWVLFSQSVIYLNKPFCFGISWCFPLTVFQSEICQLPARTFDCTLCNQTDLQQPIC